MITRNIQSLFVVTALLFSGLVFAANTPTPTKEEAAPIEPTDPIVMLKTVTTEVQQALKANSSRIDAKTEGVYEVADKYILPHVDFNEMSVWVAGRTAWGKASEATREAFISQFKVLVVRTYATALYHYTNEKLEFPKQHIDEKKERIQVTSTLVRSNKDSIRLDYRLIKHDHGWLVYDIIIEGVSILQGFQAQFSEKIRQQGLEKVIAQIKEHNNKKSEG